MLPTYNVVMKRFATDNIESIHSRNCHLNEQLLEDDVRESMRRDLPNWLQPLLTNLTAKPYQGEKSYQQTALSNVWSTFFALILGICVSDLSVNQSGFYLLLLPLGWCLTIHGLRKLRLTIVHACSHYSIFEYKKFNIWLGSFISILTLTLNFKDYQKGHIKAHHSKNLLLLGDETYEYLITTVGFRLGMTVDEAWRHLMKTIISPSFYLRRFYSRLKESFFSNSWKHNLLSIAFWSSILIIIVITDSWLVFLIAWLIPLSIFFETSSLLRQCVEHKFPNTHERDSEILQQMTAAIFCGERNPNYDYNTSWIRKFMAWSHWWLRLFFYHLPSRYLILTGDTPCHDWHHRYPRNLEWSNSIFERQKDLETGELGWKYQHSWGLIEAMNKTFESLSYKQST